MVDMTALSRTALKWIMRAAAATALLPTACSSYSSMEARTVPPPIPSREQRIVDDSTATLDRMRTEPGFEPLQATLRESRGVIILPRVTRAALIVGGEGGKGVLLARNLDGQWSSPAFYSMRGGSAGPQIGFEEASVVLVLMTQHALDTALTSGLTLGANVSVAAGSLGTAGMERDVGTASDVYQFTEVGGLYAGAALFGAVISAREDLNQDYYGASATPYQIVMGRGAYNPATRELRQELAAL